MRVAFIRLPVLVLLLHNRSSPLKAKGETGARVDAMYSTCSRRSLKCCLCKSATPTDSCLLLTLSHYLTCPSNLISSHFSR